jgi:hypothetical protein
MVKDKPIYACPINGCTVPLKQFPNLCNHVQTMHKGCLLPRTYNGVEYVNVACGKNVCNMGFPSAKSAKIHRTKCDGTSKVVFYNSSTFIQQFLYKKTIPTYLLHFALHLQAGTVNVAYLCPLCNTAQPMPFHDLCIHVVNEHRNYQLPYEYDGIMYGGIPCGKGVCNLGFPTSAAAQLHRQSCNGEWSTVCRICCVSHISVFRPHLIITKQHSSMHRKQTSNQRR